MHIDKGAYCGNEGWIRKTSRFLAKVYEAYRTVGDLAVIRDGNF